MSTRREEALVVLTNLRRRFEDKDNWVKYIGQAHKDLKGTVFSPSEFRPTNSWCLSAGATADIYVDGFRLDFPATEVYQYLCDAIRKEFPERYRERESMICKVMLFNDDPATTHQDLLKVLDRAVDLASQN